MTTNCRRCGRETKAKMNVCAKCKGELVRLAIDIEMIEELKQLAGFREDLRQKRIDYNNSPE